MNTKKVCATLLLFLCIAFQVKSEARWEKDLYTALDKKDFKTALAVLGSWKADQGEADPQYWVAGGNIWFEAAYSPTLEIIPAPFKQAEGKDELVFTNPQTGEVAGKITDGKPLINNEDMKKAIAFLDEGIRRFPYRLDIFTGRAHLYRTLEDLKGEIASLESLIRDPKPKSSNYETAPGKLLQGSLEEYQLDMLMAYAREHVQKQDQTNDAAAKAVAELAIKSFPTRPHGYNLMGALASFENNWTESKKWFLLALKQAPEDSLVISNLGKCYEKLEDLESAIEQYNQVIRLNNDSRIVEDAKEKLKKLKLE